MHKLAISLYYILLQLLPPVSVPKIEVSEPDPMKHHSVLSKFVTIITIR